MLHLGNHRARAVITKVRHTGPLAERLAKRAAPQVRQRPRLRWWQFGEIIARITHALRIRECGGCRKRRTWLNRFGAKLRRVVAALKG